MIDMVQLPHIPKKLEFEDELHAATFGAAIGSLTLVIGAFIGLLGGGLCYKLTVGFLGEPLVNIPAAGAAVLVNSWMVFSGPNVRWKSPLLWVGIASCWVLGWLALLAISKHYLEPGRGDFHIGWAITGTLVGVVYGISKGLHFFGDESNKMSGLADTAALIGRFLGAPFGPNIRNRISIGIAAVPISFLFGCIVGSAVGTLRFGSGKPLPAWYIMGSLFAIMAAFSAAANPPTTGSVAIAPTTDKG